MLGAIRHTFKYLDIDSFVLLYKSLIRPHLEYATVIWDPKTKRDKDMVERVQRRATKLVPSISHLPYSQRLRALGLPTLLFRRKRADIILLYKITHGLVTCRTSNHCNLCSRAMLTPSLATSTRGHSYKYQIQCSKGPRANFYPARVIPMWNKLSEQTVTSKSVNLFKSRLSAEWTTHKDLYEYEFSY